MKRTRQPGWPTLIDRSNLLGAKVLTHFPLSPRVPRGLKTTEAVTLAGTGAYTTGRRGFHLNGTGGGGGSVPIDLSAHAQITIACSFIYHSYPNADGLLYEFTNNFNNNVGSFIADIDSSDTTANVGWLKGTGYSFWSFPRPSVSTWHRLILAIDITQVGSAAAAVSVYVDGVAQSLTGVVTDAGADAPSFANDTLYLLSRNNASLFPTAAIEGLTIYRGILSPAEAREDFRNPYQILHRWGGGFVAVSLAQFLRPEADITDGTWIPSTGSDLYATIDEVVADEADYDSTPVSGTMEVRLSDGIDPVSSTDHKVRYRIKGTSNLIVTLLQGGTTIATWTHAPAPTSYTTFEQTLSGGEADAITDYTDLRLRFTAS